MCPVWMLKSKDSMSRTFDRFEIASDVTRRGQFLSISNGHRCSQTASSSTTGITIWASVFHGTAGATVPFKLRGLGEL